MGITSFKIPLVMLATVMCFSKTHIAESVENEITQPTIILNTTGDEPLNTPDQKGIMDLIAQKAFRRCGYRLKLDKLPAERALHSADMGLIDGELSRIEGIDETYPNLIRVPEKILDWYFVAFSKKILNLNNGWESLSNYNIAFINGWKIYESLTPRSARVIKTKNKEQLFNLLARDRTDIVLYHRVGGNYIVGQLKLKDVKELTPPLSVKEMFIYLNKKHSKLVPELAKAISDMKKDGTYDRIVNRNYASVNPEQVTPVEKYK